ncbi:hypothetical protein FHG87_016501 [Trinorchestia longiramus]|nr:hypothetical protein FHG87_016501 [Trinorchestia longiramus]
MICNHQGYCHPYCYRRHMRAARRLLHAVRKVKPPFLLQEAPAFCHEGKAALSARRQEVCFRVQLQIVSCTQVYGDEQETTKGEITTARTLSTHRSGGDSSKKDKKHRKSIEQGGHSSPIKRRDSFPKRDKIEKPADLSGVLTRLGHHQGSSMHLSKDTLATEAGHHVDTSPEKKDSDEKCEPPPVVKYIRQQVSGLFHAPLSLACKSLVLLPEELLRQAAALAWELLLEHDNEWGGGAHARDWCPLLSGSQWGGGAHMRDWCPLLSGSQWGGGAHIRNWCPLLSGFQWGSGWRLKVAATAGVVFIVAGVRVPQYTSDVISRELTHSDPSVRLNAILRFQTLWRSRHQAWPRMEEGGQVTFKVPPHGIEFTLPSPKVGVESLHVVDPPWMPLIKMNVEEVTLSQIQHVSNSAPEVSPPRSLAPSVLLRSFITANRTRHKLQEEMVKTALKAEECKRRTERENFLLSTVPVTIQAAYEPALHHVTADEEKHEDEEKEGEKGESKAAEGTSLRPLAAPPVTVAQQLFPSSLCSAVLTIIHLLDDPAVTPDGVAVYQVAHQVRVPGPPPGPPPGTCTRSPPGTCTRSATRYVSQVHHLVRVPGPSTRYVYQVPHQVIWLCLVEDSALFLRFFLEKLTRERQDVMVRLLRRLIRFIPHLPSQVPSLALTGTLTCPHRYPHLPSQAAFALYNYMVGYVMFCVRTPGDTSQQHIAAAHAILWNVVPSMQGILFKDLKQIFRKEQCDSFLLLTANVPSAKKIIVHGPGGADAGGIPSQFPIQEDTQFCQILQEALDFFGIPEQDHNSYFLFDHKTNQMHNPQSFVRDFYFFKRAQYPQLVMVHMDPAAAREALQLQAFTHKLIEIGKVLMAWAVMRQDQVAQRVFFLHEELTKLPAFPRKALEADFHLYHGGSMAKVGAGGGLAPLPRWQHGQGRRWRRTSTSTTVAAWPSYFHHTDDTKIKLLCFLPRQSARGIKKEVRCIDQLHQYTWVQLVYCMCEGMAGNLTYTTDLHLFINVINGAVLLHCEDSSMLRLCLATYINIAHTFNNLFATNGYLLVMPTLLRVYSNYSSNKMVTSAVEFGVKQLYILHRKPFVLQMLGSVASILDSDEHATYGDANKVQPRRLFDLLVSMERLHEDPLYILDLVTLDKPLRALDFCYHDESDNLPLLETLDMCVTVVAFSADSKRGHQMLTILDATLSMIMQHVRKVKSSSRDGKQEREVIHHIAVSIKTMIINCEPLAKNYTGPQRPAGEGKGSSRVTYGRSSRVHGPPIEPDDDSHSKYYSDSRRHQNYERDAEDSEALRGEFRRPRDTFLHVVAEFLTKASVRLAELNRRGHDPDLLDTKCHLRLAEVAHTLLKVAPYDPATMRCRGLVRYMNEILPYPDWSREDLRPALINILRRLDKMFNKIAKNSSIRRHTDWNAAAALLKGLFLTLSKFPFIAHLPHLKLVMQVCQVSVSPAPPQAGDAGVPVYLSFNNFFTVPIISYLKSLLLKLNVITLPLQSLVLGERLWESEGGGGVLGGSSGVGGAFGGGGGGGGAALGVLTPPQHFCSMVVKTIALHIVAMGVSYSLEQACGGSAVMPTQERTENLIMNLLLPLCLRVGCGRKDVPKLRQIDLTYALSVLLFAINPPLAKVGGGPHPGTGGVGGAGGKSGLGGVTGGAVSGDQRQASWSQIDSRGAIYPKLRPTLLRAAFLGLKVMLVCFEKQLSNDWLRILHCLRDLDSRGQVGHAFWDFLDFTATYRTPLFLLMRPFILCKLKCSDATSEHYRGLVKGRLLGLTLPRPRSRGSLLLDLARQVKSLKEELTSSRLLGETETRPSTLEVQSEVPSGRPKKSKTTAPEAHPNTRSTASPPPPRQRRGQA